MSRRTRSVAVAVNAWNETPGKSSRRRPSCRYSGRKSWPHWLMQCASSIAMNRSCACWSIRRSVWLPSPAIRSGDTYRSRQRPSRTLASTSSRSCGRSVLFRYDAATPSTRRPSTWSFISEMSGDTTRASPRGSTMAGAWKHSDLPPPVGSTTMLSRDSRMACIASRWSGRNAEKPQTRWSASASRRSASGVVVLDVVIDQALEFGGELVVGAAQGRGVAPVDEHRAARLLAGAGQADADIGGLRFPRAVDHAAHHRERHRFHAFVRGLPFRHPVADVALDALGQLLERAARRAAAAWARRDARRKRAQPERLQE